MLGVVLVSTDFPQVLRQGLATTGGVALREERGVVLVDLHEVFATQCHCLAYRIEACSDEQLLCRWIGRALHLAADIHAVTVIARGSRYAVGAQEHFGTRVLTALARFGECSGYAIDTGTPIYFCHR